MKPVSSEEQLKKLEQYEKEHRGNFRKIYPNQKMHMYSVFFCQGTSSLFNETFASRARERVSKLMKEGIQVFLYVDLHNICFLIHYIYKL